MLKVTKKPKTPNMVWDTVNNRPLCKFCKGVIETNDETLAEKLKALGHEVTGEVDKADPEQTVSEQPEQPEQTEQEQTDADPEQTDADQAAEKATTKRRTRK